MGSSELFRSRVGEYANVEAWPLTVENGRVDTMVARVRREISVCGSRRV